MDDSSPIPDATGFSSSIEGGVHQDIAHESAHLHVTGSAAYIDDLPELPGTLHLAVCLSDKAHGTLRSVDVTEARSLEGICGIWLASDVPGDGDIGAIAPGDPVLAVDKVEYAGQAIALIAAQTRDQARAAARQIHPDIEDLPAILSIEQAMAANSMVSPPITMARNDADQAIAAATGQLAGKLDVGGQDHFYLEGHIAYAIPGENGEMLVHSSTQHPAEVQHAIAKVLRRPMHSITVQCRRMGGGFGGKESQAGQIACLAALAAHHTGKPAKLRLDRDDDMLMTGKRHDFRIDWKAGFEKDGRLTGLTMDLAGRCGMSLDLSNGVVDRAMFHADNAYYLPAARITGYRCRTNTVSNTAFRGFGGPQGVIAIEAVLDDIARHLGIDPIDVQMANLYGGEGRETTHYGMEVTDGPLLRDLFTRIEVSADYRQRRAAVNAFNASSPYLKKGLAVCPVKFGISFTVKHLNQASALVHVYTDGTVQVNHGGTEMGQGIHTKMAQIAAEMFQIDVSRVKVTASVTDKVPNAPPTAASAGTDLNGQAVRRAVLQIRGRIIRMLADHCAVSVEDVVFRNSHVYAGNTGFSFADVAMMAYRNRVPLSATGHYTTPKIWWDRDKGVGHPFYYFSCGIAVSEVLVDCLTGEYRFLRADILHDCSGAINPAIDRGQVEGAFVQGLGWVTSEELFWDGNGRLRTHAPSTYKIPTSRSLPEDFRVTLHTSSPNSEETIFRSKAVGEPPLMLGISGWLALRDAVSTVGNHKLPVELDAPATPERVLMAIERIRQATRP